jgi:hypothetical protein
MSKKAKLLAAGSLIIAALVLGECGVVGPYSIEHGRTSYNEVIHQTSADQLFLNLIRIHQSEMPLFMDVTEVDASVLIQGAITGGTAGIGATKGTSGGTLAGEVSNVAGTGEYQESPVVRYQPLQGQPLIAQVNSPISADSISNLLSSWSVASVLTFTLDRLTKDYSDYGVAINAIIDLDAYGALIIQATASENSNAKQSTTIKTKDGTTVSIPVTSNGQAQGTNDAITLFFSNKYLDGKIDLICDGGTEANYTYLYLSKIATHLWIRLLKLYSSEVKPADLANIDAEIDGAKNQEQLDTVTQKLPKSIKLPMRASERPPVAPPILIPRSALGVLRSVADPKLSKLAAFVSPEQAKEIFDYNQGKCASPDFYIDPTSSSDRPELVGQISRENTANIRTDPTRPGDIRNEYNLQTRRVFLVIQQSSTPPSDAYVETSANGVWYFISNNDAISKRSLALLSLITTIQAIPTASPSLTPSLSVGAK